jgi:hypothetical protein
MPCDRPAVEQFLYVNLATGLYRVSKPQCVKHSTHNQPPESAECLRLDLLTFDCAGEDWR